jgi:putative tricarboxylic transport membrane protein
MTRSVQDIAFTILLMVVIGVAVWDAQKWEIKARLFPWVIGIPLLGMLAVLLAVQLARHLRDADLSGGGIAMDATARRRAYAIIGWLLGFLAAIWVLGFPIGGTLGTLAFLKFGAREKWPISLAISAGTAIFFVLMINGLNTPFPKGTLVELVGI